MSGKSRPDASLPPSASGLREAALAHLARFATSEAGLARVLERRVARWARRALELGGDPDQVRQVQEQAGAQVRAVVVDMARLGAVDDAAFAEGRARALARGGRSRRAIAAHLASRGIDPDRIEEAVHTAQSSAFDSEPSDNDHAARDDAGLAELGAALVQARRRRIGPFSVQPVNDEPDQSARQRALAALARAGFSHDVATRALDSDREAAEALIARLRRG